MVDHVWSRSKGRNDEGKLEVSRMNRPLLFRSAVKNAIGTSRHSRHCNILGRFWSKQTLANRRLSYFLCPSTLPPTILRAAARAGLSFLRQVL